MKTEIEMNSFESEPDAIEVISYSDEIMNVGWNPAVELVCEILQVPTEEEMARAAEIPEMETEDVSAAVSEIFMRKMYSYQG